MEGGGVWGRFGRQGPPPSGMESAPPELCSITQSLGWVWIYRRIGGKLRRGRRHQSRAAYGADYTRNLRWRYRRGHGSGREYDPYYSGGSFGYGYGRSWGLGPQSPPTPYDAELRARERRARRWPGTAARDYDQAYPYFGRSAAFEAAQGYPPSDPLVPDDLPEGDYPRRQRYDEEWDYDEDW